MLRRALIWALYSPRRLAGVLAVGVIAMAALSFVVTEQHRQDLPSSSNVEIRPQNPERSWKPVPGTERPSSDDQSRKVAERFLAAYLRDPNGNRANSMADLRRLSTDVLWRGLRLTSPERLPAGPAKSLDRTIEGTHLNQYVAHLPGGRELSLQVVSNGQDWRVSGLQAVGQ